PCAADSEPERCGVERAVDAGVGRIARSGGGQAAIDCEVEEAINGGRAGEGGPEPGARGIQHGVRVVSPAGWRGRRNWAGPDGGESRQPGLPAGERGGPERGGERGVSHERGEHEGRADVQWADSRQDGADVDGADDDGKSDAGAERDYGSEGLGAV